MEKRIGKRDQKNKNIMHTDTPMTKTACPGLNPQHFTIPVPMSHHFQGSVSQIKKGIQEARRVTPEERAYTVKNLAKVTRFLMVMVITMYPRPAAIKTMPMALMKNIPPIKRGLTGVLLTRLAPAKKRLDTERKPRDCFIPTPHGSSPKNLPGSFNILVKVRK